jgi:signal transduction histidine kinase
MLADSHYARNDYAAAQQEYLKALKQAEGIHDYPALVHACISIAKCHYYLRDRLSASKWLHRARQVALNHEQAETLPDIHYLLSLQYIETGQVDSAEYHANWAIGHWNGLKDYARLSTALLALSDLYLNTTKDAAKAEQTIREAEGYAQLANDKSSLAFAAMKWYFYHALLKKDYAAALPHVSTAEKLYLQLRDREGIGYAYSFKAECLARMGDTTAADYFWKWFSFKDSIFQEEKSVAVAKYESLYKMEKKEQQNRLLQQQNARKQLWLLIAGIAMLLMVAVGLWLNNRYRLRQKQQELEMMQKIQNDKIRIARDLHDNIGGQLSYITHSIDSLAQANEDRRREVAQGILESARGAIGSLRETIWAIHDAEVGVQDFADKLKVFARALFKHGPATLHFSETIDDEGKLNALFGLNLYRICQEVLTNAMKYAQATRVEVDIRYSGPGLSITISDNGIGFDPEQPQKDRYGLENIKYRAMENGIALHLATTPGQGTRYVLEV